jgi:predicted hydrolase (HD superfamily)
MLDLERGRQLLAEWTDSPSLLAHGRAVEISMRAACARHAGGEDEERWALAGLLHDADYDRWPEEHPRRIVAWLREQGEDAVACAVAGHYTRWGVPRTTLLARALLACDELTGFTVACALVRPDGIRSLAPRSVLKRLKDKRFAASVDRGEIQTGFEELGVEPAEHIQMILDALVPHAEELGLLGRDAGD